MKAKKGDNVKVHYTGTLGDGTQFDSSAGRDPLQFELGAGKVIAGFDNAVDGMEVGEKVKVTIDAENAYGTVKEDLLFEVPLKEFPEDVNPAQGQKLSLQQPSGDVFHVRVAEVKEESAVLDANHELAGEALTFEIELVEIG